MKKKLCLAFAFCLLVTLSRATTVQWGVAKWYDFASPSISYLVITTPLGGSMDTDIHVTSTPMHVVLGNNLTDYTLAWGALLLETDCGTLIDSDLFANSTDPFFQTYDIFSGVRTSETNVTIGLYETVFLAFAIGYPNGSDFDASWYGWVELGYDPTKGGV